ncbi:MAG: M28 family peptidase [Phycisphaeraceae bacterium]|nr:M28 family peptidase [Phycisphaeraceae bacterium]
MKRPWCFLACLFLISGCAAPKLPQPTQDFRGLVEQLADPSMEGRGLGTAGLDRARDFVLQQLQSDGLVPAFSDNQYLQAISFRFRSRAVTIHNIAAGLPGCGDLAEQCIIVGAHYDHLGIGTQREGIFPGADDNASGTAAMLLLARRWAQRAEHDPAASRRTLIFVGFSSEEHDLRGSRHFVTHPEALAFDLHRAAAMINLDMVGRLRERTLYVIGNQTAPWWPQAIMAAHQHTPELQLRPIPIVLAVADHEPFAGIGIPVLQLFTGLHEDYHQPSDVAWKINAAGGELVVDFADALLQELAYDPAYTGRTTTALEASTP